MEPMNCTVHVTPDGCDIWVGTQIPEHRADGRRQGARAHEGKVRIHNHLLGGGFGRRLEFDFILQAALIAKQSKDPVKVMWSREEDIQHDMYRPYYYDRISAGLDRAASSIAWNHRIVGSSIMARFFPPLFKDGLDPDAVDGAIELPYEIPNFFVDYVREEPPGIPTAFWRGVGPTRNAYVVESFIDELAAAAKKDPVEFRRELTGNNPRARHVLERAAATLRLGDAARAAQGPRHRAAVCVRHLYVAEVAEVTVADDGEVHVDRVVCGRRLRPGGQPEYGRGADAERHHLRHHRGAVGRDHAQERPRRADQLRRLPDAAHRTRRRRSRSRSSKAARLRAASASPARRR